MPSRASQECLKSSKTSSTQAILTGLILHLETTRKRAQPPNKPSIDVASSPKPPATLPTAYLHTDTTKLSSPQPSTVLLSRTVSQKPWQASLPLSLPKPNPGGDSLTDRRHRNLYPRVFSRPNRSSLKKAAPKRSNVPLSQNQTSYLRHGPKEEKTHDKTTQGPPPSLNITAASAKILNHLSPRLSA